MLVAFTELSVQAATLCIGNPAALAIDEDRHLQMLRKKVSGGKTKNSMMRAAVSPSMDDAARRTRSDSAHRNGLEDTL